MKTANLDEKNHWTAKANDWHKWADILTASAALMNAPLLSKMDLQPSQKILDLASGAGEPALSIAKIIGATGAIVASDISEAMLSAILKRNKIISGSLPQLSLCVASMDDLPFASNSFDRITCRFGLMFIHDKIAALRKIKPLLKKDGIIGLATWGDLKDQALFSAIEIAVKKVCKLNEISDFARIFNLSSPEIMRNIMKDAEYSKIICEQQSLTFDIEYRQGIFRPITEMTFGHLWADYSEDQKSTLYDRIEHEILHAIENYRKGFKSYSLDTQIIISLGYQTS